MNAKCCKGEYFSSQILKAVAAVIKVNFITAGKLCKFTALCIYIQLPPTDFEWARFMKSPTSCKIKTFSYLSCRLLQLLQSDNSQSVSVVGQSCLGMFAVVPYRLHHLKKWKCSRDLNSFSMHHCVFFTSTEAGKAWTGGNQGPVCRCVFLCGFAVSLL